MLLTTSHTIVRMGAVGEPSSIQGDREGLHFRSQQAHHPLTGFHARRNGFQAWVNEPSLTEADIDGDESKYDRRRSKMPRLSSAAILVVFVFPLILIWHYTHNLAPYSADFEGYEGFEGEHAHSGRLESRRGVRSGQYPIGKTAPLRSSSSAHHDQNAVSADGATDTASSHLASLVSPVDPRLLSSAPNQRGLLRIPSNMSLTELSEHPITTLIHRAEKMAEALEDKINSIKTLDDAVSDYVERWGMQPPAGFDKWCVAMVVIRDFACDMH